MTIALVPAFIPAFENPRGLIAWRSSEKPELAMANAADFRRIALSFEGAGEYPHFDRRAFKARVTFATLAPDELSANIKFAPDEQALKCAVAPDAFAALDNAWGGAAGPARHSLPSAKPNSSGAGFGLAPCGAEGESAKAAIRPDALIAPRALIRLAIARPEGRAFFRTPYAPATFSRGRRVRLP